MGLDFCKKVNPTTSPPCIGSWQSACVSFIALLLVNAGFVFTLFVRPTYVAFLATQDLARTESGTARWCGATQSPSATSGGAEETVPKSAACVEGSSQVLL